MKSKEFGEGNMKILVLNGPNINMLGKRETNIYGENSFDDLIFFVKAFCDQKDIDVSFAQSNSEGDLISYLQEADQKYDGVVFNPAGYTHTSVALLDAVLAIKPPVIEVHLTNPKKRERFRKKSYVSRGCELTISGLGFVGYTKAIEYLTKNTND